MMKRLYPTYDPAFAEIRRIFTDRINLLCIEDAPEISILLCDEFFRSPVLTRTTADTFKKAESAVRSKPSYHCWILDLTIERHNDGLDLLRTKPSFPYCVVVSNSSSLYDATVAIRGGAFGAYDKNAAIVSNAGEFIKEICALSTLSFLLHARKPERFDMFTLLIDRCIRSQEEWGRAYYRNERSVRNICEEYSGLTARQFLYLFHTLNATLRSDCLIEGMAGYEKSAADLNENERFYKECSKYVVSRFDRVFGPKCL